MAARRARTALAGALALSMLLAAAGPAEAAKKKAKLKPFSQTLAVNAAVPDAVAATQSVPLTSTITVPKKYKGKVVGDVNVTGIQTTGSAAGAASQLSGYLIAPGGRTFQLFLGVGDQNLGPWTIDDDTPVGICNVAVGTPCPNPEQSLGRPFAGTSNSNYNSAGSFPMNGRLTIFDGVSMRGAWKLLLSDNAPAATSVLNQWGLRITPAKPVKG